MLRGIRSRCVFAGIAAVLASSSPAQNKLTDVQITGHVYEPQRLSPTDARIASLQLPTGFSIQRSAEGLDNPRMLAVADDGTIYVTQRNPGNVVMLRDTNGDGIVDVQRIVARIRNVHGIEIRGREIYLVDIRRIYVAALQPDGSLWRLRSIVRDLPDAGQHPNRTLRFSPQGELFVTVGSTCNECREPNPQHATIQRLRSDAAPDANGRLWQGNREIFASGLRNTLGFDWHPGSGRLFAFDNGIDWLGDDDQSEELNEVIYRQRYGWPYVYDDDQINPHTEPLQVSSEHWAALSEEPVALYTPHSAPMQMRFYGGTQFPAEYRASAYAAMRGSWNRKPPSGYEVLRLQFGASGEFESFAPFVDGFLQEIPNGFGFFGRPVGVAVDTSGALLFSDDTNNMLYRVVYGTPQGTPSPQELAAELFDVPATIDLASSAIPAGGTIPERYTDYGKGISPPLAWRGVPANAVSLLVMMEDPDAVAPLPFVHWTIVNIDPRRRGLPEGIAKVFRPLRDWTTRQGTNSKSERGYFGPRPPPGDPPHNYRFQVFALDTRLDLPDGFNRHALLAAMQGHVLAKGEFVASYARPLVP
jgi:Raf kinase inhibitor-like YbhB/YbcL family protein